MLPPGPSVLTCLFDHGAVTRLTLGRAAAIGEDHVALACGSLASVACSAQCQAHGQSNPKSEPDCRSIRRAQDSARGGASIRERFDSLYISLCLKVIPDVDLETDARAGEADSSCA